VINHLRRALGWLEIDLDGRWRWPMKSDHRDPRMGRASSPRGGRRLGSGNETCTLQAAS
jgi:hypothetical protein